MTNDPVRSDSGGLDARVKYRALRAAAALLLGFLLWPTAVAASEADAKQIREAFEQYRGALLAGKGHQAASALSQSTYDYYDQMRKLALLAASKDLHRQPLADQLQVLLYRSRVPRDMLESMSPSGLISHSIEQGWIAKDSVGQFEAGKVDVRGNEAVLYVVAEGRDSGPAFLYRREPGGWRLDLVPVMRATEKPLRDAAYRENMEVGDFILAVVERAVGRELGVEAWIPLVERDAAPDTLDSSDTPADGEN